MIEMYNEELNITELYLMELECIEPYLFCNYMNNKQKYLFAKSFCQLLQ